MKLPAYLASDNALEGFLRGFFAPVYLLMSFFEKKEIKEEKIINKTDTNVNYFDIEIYGAQEKSSKLIYTERLIKTLAENPNDYNYLKLLAHRLNEAVLHDNSFEFKKVLGQISAYSPNLDLPDESVEFRVEFRKMVLALSYYCGYSNIIEKHQTSKKTYSNTHLQAMENVLTFHADSFKPYKKLVDAHEKAQ